MLGGASPSLFKTSVAMDLDTLFILFFIFIFSWHDFEKPGLVDKIDEALLFRLIAESAGRGCQKHN